MKALSIVTSLVFAVFGAACASTAGVSGSAEAAASAEPGPAAAAVGSRAPDFELSDSTGTPVKLSALAGKIVVLEWINPQCPFVKRHADAGTMKSLAEKYGARGVVWLGINSTNFLDAAANAAWIAERKLPYAVLDDHAGVVGHMYGARTTPHMFIVDTKGTLVYAGAIDDDNAGTKGTAAVNYVDAALAELTAGKSVSIAETKPYGCSVKYRN